MGKTEVAAQVRGYAGACVGACVRAFLCACVFVHLKLHLLKSVLADLVSITDGPDRFEKNMSQCVTSDFLNKYAHEALGLVKE